MLAAPSGVCPICPEARRRAREAMGRDLYECVCGRRYRVRLPVAPVEPAEYGPTEEPALPGPRRPLAPRRRTFRADPDAPSDARSPLARAGREATALVVSEGEAELSRVRVVLADLRPDHPDPYAPMPPRAEIDGQTIRVHDPSGAWGGIPRALASPMGGLLGALELGTRRGADVLAEIELRGGYDAPTLRWLRCDAKLAEGLRGLFYSAGDALATRSQRVAWGVSLTAKRDGAHDVGRKLVLRAVTTWEKAMRERGVR